MQMDGKKHSRAYISSILISLYSLQGLVIGLFLDTLLLQLKKTCSYVDVGTFLLCSYPFSFKVLWSPLVDTYSIGNFGRKKSWIVPCQFLAACFLYYLSLTIDEYLLQKNIISMAFIAFMVMFLVATQDIAVDSWGLQLCGKENCTLASSCQTAGQLIGMGISTFGYIHLSVSGRLSLSGFIKFISFSFLMATIAIVTVDEANEEEATPKSLRPKKLLSQTIKQLKQMLLNKNFLHFILLTLLSKVGDVFNNNIVDLVYLENGMSEQFYANVSTVASVIRIAFAYHCSSIRGNYLALFINSYKKMIFVYIGELLLLLYRLHFNSSDGIINGVFFYTLFVLFALIKVYLFELIFSSINGFFNKITDIQIGATYLTALCSANNLSEKWPGFFVFFLVDIIGFKMMGVLSIIYCFAFYHFTQQAYHDLDKKDESEWKIPQELESKPKTQ